MKRILGIAMGVFLFFWVSSVFAEITGRDIMQQQKDLYKSRTESELQKMTLIDKDGVKEEREVWRYSKEVEPDVYETLIIFSGPEDIKGTALLMWGHSDRPNDQWLYLPAQGKMQSIAEGGKKNYFMGTDFTFEDLQVKDLEAQNLDAYTYNLLDSTVFAGISCYVVEAVPATEQKQKESQYSKRILLVEDENLVTLKVDFYDRHGDRVKTQTNYAWTNVTEKIWRPDRIVMENLKTGHKTEVRTLKRTINEEIDDSTFTNEFILKGAPTNG